MKNIKYRRAQRVDNITAVTHSSCGRVMIMRVVWSSEKVYVHVRVDGVWITNKACGGYGPLRTVREAKRFIRQRLGLRDGEALG